MRKLVFVLCLVLVGSVVNAQKYRDIYPQLIAGDENEAFEVLNEFLRIEPNNPNANLRLAIIYVNRYKSVDVLREYDRALALADQAKQRLVKAKVTIDDREVRRNEEYYIGVLPDGQFSYQAIAAYIDAEYNDADAFLKNLPPIYNEFTRSVEKYDEVVKDFSDIVGSHNSLKELYLLYDAQLARRLENLKSNYDSTKIYFDSYLELRNNYPVEAVKQSYEEVPIKVYRLDGLVTQINFLQPKIQLWDYASWVDSVTAVVSSNISSLRESLVRNDKKLKAALVDVKKIDNPDSFKIVSADKSLIFNLMKYDYKNSLVPYLAYQEFKQTLIRDQLRGEYFDTASIASDRKLAYYNDMLYASKKADSIILDFDSKFDKEQLLRHRAFINETFGSPDNLKKYMDEEKESNRSLFMAQVRNIKEAILADKPDAGEGVEVKYRNTVIPVYIVEKPVRELGLNYVHTEFILPSADGSTYVAGQVITDASLKNTEVSIAKLSKENRVVWVKNYDIELDSTGSDANQYLGDIKVTAEGVVAVIRSTARDESKVANTAIHLTGDGELKFARRLKTELFPRELIYDERNNLFVASFFGDRDTVDVQTNSELTVRGINGLGEEIWHFDYACSGSYLKMLATPSQIMIGGNYTLIKNESGRTFTVPSGTNSFILSLDYSGSLKKIACYSSDTSYEMTTFYKVSDRNLNLIGSKGEHLIVDGALENIYSSVTLK